ncbi:MAG TPA: zinc ribbon domain-containing protein [Steroidobacteraceae bacterium]|nr:zinc ribbon domain-containing protein [Steroidobacteraceae bacterium]
MPIYEYRCEANGRLVEVTHKMAERLHTWGELCERAGISPGRTDPHAPVQKLISAGFIATGSSEPACAGGACELPACGNGICASGACASAEGGDF